MPQSTLMAYFKPLHPEPPVGSLENELQPRPDSVSRIQLSSLAERDAKPVEPFRKANVVATSVQEIAPPNVSREIATDLFSPPGLPQAVIMKVRKSHVERLKNVTSTLLPVRYPDKFFNECVEDDTVADLSRVLLWDSRPIGWVRCRLEENEQGFHQIYVQALGVLSPYRGSGLATNLLEQVTHPSLVRKYAITSVYCHVWLQNEIALEWYEKRGFKRVILLEQYYRRLKPAGAWILRKELI